MPSIAQAADGFEVLHWGNISELGGHTETVHADWTGSGREPVNEDWVYVYDPDFYAFLTGSVTSHDRTAEFADKGYVVVASAGSPGGTFATQPSWFRFDDVTARFDASVSDTELSIRYDASWRPTTRGYQSYIVYRNYEQVSEPRELTVYDSDRFHWPRWVSGHHFGREASLLTGDGPEAQVTVDTSSTEAAFGPSAIEIHSDADDGIGTHWKYMLFANGDAAAYAGIDLSAYDALEFYARASQPVTLGGGFGSGDDSAHRGLPAMALTTEYQRFELPLAGLDLRDINTLLWVYLHRDANAPGFDFSDVSVFLDNVRFVQRDTFATESALYTLGEQRNADGAPVYREVLYDRAVSYVSIFEGAENWVAERAIMHNRVGALRQRSLHVLGFYVKDCFTGTWLDASHTIFGPSTALTARTFDGRYDIHHGYGNIAVRGFLDPQLECVDSTRTGEVLFEGVPMAVPLRGVVDFAVVVEHR